MAPSPELSREDESVASLFEKFRDLRREDPAVGVGALRDDAGDLYRDLSDAVECEDLIRAALADDARDDLPREFGEYRLLEVIGSGAGGIVYKAARTGDGQPAAIKVMRAGLGTSEEALARFGQEASAAASLEDPHLVRVLDAGEVDGRMFIAMELLPGSSLAAVIAEIVALQEPAPTGAWLEVLDRHRLPAAPRAGRNVADTFARRLAASLAPVAQALGAMARAGCVHRDIKPQNLVLDGEGRFKVTDFGLAKVFGRDLTPTLAVLGTPAYMSPEQARGDSRQVDGRSDLYSLGATLYEALTLHYPAEAESFGETLAAILAKKPRPLADFCPDYPRAIQVMVERCLEKDPADRYADADALAQDLAQYAGHGTVRMRPVSRARRAQSFLSRNRNAAAVVVSVLLLAVGGFVLWNLRPATIRLYSQPAGGRFVLDGEEVAVSRWDGSLGAGDYALRVEMEHFRPHRERLKLVAGQTVDRPVPLLPLPGDPVALERLAQAYGAELRLPEGPPPTARWAEPPPGTPWFRRCEIVAPRGRVRDVVICVRAEPSVEGLSVEVAGDGGETVHEAAVPDGIGVVTLALPPDVALHAGVEYGIRLKKDGEPAPDFATFTRVEAPGQRERSRVFPASIRSDPSVRVVVAAGLVADGLYADAWLTLRPATAKDPLGKRLALEALARMGLDGSATYRELQMQKLEVRR